jgi:hypothetical protein
MLNIPNSYVMCSNWYLRYKRSHIAKLIQYNAPWFDCAIPTLKKVSTIKKKYLMVEL